MFKFNSIQNKIGISLTIILLLAIGLIVGFTALQSRSLLKQQQESALSAAHRAALTQTRSIFQSLSLGTSSSLERGDMDSFNRLLTGLGSVPGVKEVGLTDQNGKILFSSSTGKVDSYLEGLEITRGNHTKTQERESADAFFMARGHSFEQRCMECHSGAKEGELAGILYVDYSLDNLHQEEQRQLEALGAASRKSLTGGFTIGFIGLVAACLVLIFLLRNLIIHPLSLIQGLLREIERGHLKTRLRFNRQDELGETAQTLDNLAESLDHEIVGSLQKLAHGNLTFEVAPRDSDDLLRGALQKLGDDLNTIMQQIQRAGEQIASGSTQIADASQSLSQSATESAASLEEITRSVSEMSSQTEANAEIATVANGLASEAQSAAEKGNRRMKDMVAAMTEINESGRNISKIIKVIDEIAFQTNLLALNAAVEAARAGKHGKGFAVVAEEVRNLAARSAKAAKETAELIEGSSAKTERGSEIAAQTSTAFKEIISGVSKVSGLVIEITASSKEQEEGISQIRTGITQVDQATQQNTSNAEESAAAAEELSSQATQLKQMLRRFKLRAHNSPLQDPYEDERMESPPTSRKKISNGPETVISLDDREFGRF
jgi:methyl-accepting chemotaxis protein